MKIIALVGSSMFRDEYISVIEREARKGNACIGLTEIISKDREMITDHPYENHVAPEELLGILHTFKLQCVAIANEVLVLDVGGYVGKDTAEAIQCASTYGKPIRFLSMEAV